MDKKKLEQKQFFSEWLEKLQQESWQLELLISGFALYGIWESHDYLYYLNDYINANSTGFVNGALDILLSILMIGWAIFFTNLLVHIILRGLWIGAIGLRYVSGDIEYSELNYSEIITDHLKKSVGDFDDYIERLEKLSSIIFSYTFLLFFLFLSFLLLVVEFLVIMFAIGHFFLGSSTEQNSIGVVIMGVLGLIFFLLLIFIVVDVITLGGLKRIKEPTISKIYLFFYKIFSLLSLSRIYRPILYNFLDNKFTKRLFLFGVPYGICISLILPGFFLNNSNLSPIDSSLRSNEGITAARYTLNPFYYDDLRSNHYKTNSRHKEIHYASLANYEVDDDHLKVFLRFRSRDSELFDTLSISHAPFSNPGIRHRGLFDKYIIDDQLKDSIILENSKERLVMKKMAKNLPLNDDEIDSSYIETYSGTSKDSIKSLVKKINAKWKPALDDRSDRRYKEIIEGMKKINQFSIDTLAIEPSKCYFMTHENLGEKGVICYLKIDSIPSGAHELLIKRKFLNSSKNIYIPFFKK